MREWEHGCTTADMTRRAHGKITKAGRRDLRVCTGGSGASGSEQPSTLEGGVGTTGTALGTEQGDRSNCARVIGYRLACAGAQGGGPFRRTGKGSTKDAALCLRSWEGKSTWATNGGTICARTNGCFGYGSGVDQHPLGLEETDPIAALELKKGERRPK